MVLGNLAGFNANDYEDSSRDALPAGWYAMVIQDTEMKPTKAGDGKLLEIVLRCMNGETKGRQVWDRINTKNPSAICVEIGQRQLASLCRAIGIMEPRDSAEFHGKQLGVLLACREWNGSIQNDVKKYVRLDKMPLASIPQPPPLPEAAATKADDSSPFN